MDEKSDYDKEIDEVKKKCGIDPIRQAESAGILDSTIRVSRGNLERKQQQLAMSKSAIASLTKDLAKAEDEYSKLTQKDSSVVAVPETEWKNISIFLEDICKKFKRVPANTYLERLKNELICSIRSSLNMIKDIRVMLKLVMIIQLSLMLV